MTHFIFILLLSSQIFASEQAITNFAKDLEHLFSIEAKRTLEVGDVTHFTAQLNPNGMAEASYNPLLNTIFLKKENLNSTGIISYNVKSITEMKTAEPMTYSVKVGTIFHELGHSEMDQFILKGITAEDRMLLNLYKTEFIPWVKKNYPGVNPKTLFQEFYGYYRGDAIETYFQDKSTIESFNGYNIYQHRCFNTMNMKKLVSILSREEFSELFIPENEPTWKESYGIKFFPRYVFIQGKDVDLMKNPTDPFKETWKKAFWSYFVANYHAPKNMEELALYFRKHHDDRNFIKNCRNKIWDEYHIPSLQF
jgi:hypothetical protein